VNHPMKCRKCRDEVKTGEKSLIRDQAWGETCQGPSPAASSDLRHKGGRKLWEAGVWNVGTRRLRCQETSHKLKNSEGESIEARAGDGATRSSEDILGNQGGAKGLPTFAETEWSTGAAGRNCS
jgi:hypothetical protein